MLQATQLSKLREMDALCTADLARVQMCAYGHRWSQVLCFLNHMPNQQEAREQGQLILGCYAHADASFLSSAPFKCASLCNVV